MVNEELIVQAAEAAKIEVDATEVQAALDEIKQQNNLDDAELAQALAAQGYTMSNYKHGPAPPAAPPAARSTSSSRRRSRSPTRTSARATTRCSGGPTRSARSSCRTS